MFNSLKNPTSTDKRALAVFFGIALLCAVYFASGILVSYVSPPSDFIEMSKDGKGAVVEISNIPTFEVALQLSNALMDQRHLQSIIEVSPTGFGYLLRVGPVGRRSMAERLAEELRTTGYDQIAIRESCPEGRNCPQGSVTVPGGATGPAGPTGVNIP